MITKDELLHKTDELIEKLRGEQINFMVLIFSPSGHSKIDSYAEKCIDFQKKVKSSSGEDDSIYELYKEFIVLERTTKRRSAMLSALPSIMILYVSFFAVFFLLTSVDISGFLEKTLGVSAPGKLITLGVAGAFVYLATNGLIRTEKEDSKTQFSVVLNLTTRFILAVIVPIILVVLFFNEDGTAKELTLSPELLSFACGYSAKLVVELFNKIVEKGSKMIGAI
jgi:hypothetical protein